MNRMDKVFGELMQSGEGILITIFPIGDPIIGEDNGLEWATTYFDNGSSMLEIILPIEEPSLDGPTVANSMARALERTNLDEVFATISGVRKNHPDKVLQIMSYFETVQRYGMKEFAKICDDCGVDAVLVPDTPPGLYAEMDESFAEYNIFNIRFVPFHLTDEVMEDLKANAKGYIFMRAVDGTTGVQATVSPQVGKNAKLIKDAGVITPCIAGFGISTPDQVAEAKAMGADGVVVGSALISRLEAGEGESFIKAFSEASRVIYV